MDKMRITEQDRGKHVAPIVYLFFFSFSFYREANGQIHHDGDREPTATASSVICSQF